MDKLARCICGCHQPNYMFNIVEHAELNCRCWTNRWRERYESVPASHRPDAGVPSPGSEEA